MNNDGVSIAFELIADELGRVADDIAHQGSLAFKKGSGVKPSKFD